MTEIYFFTVLELEVQHQRSTIFSFWYMLYSWLADNYLLAGSSDDLSSAHVERDREGKSEKAIFLMSLLIRTLMLLNQGQGPTLRTSFNLNLFLTGPISKCRHTGG